MPDGGDGSTGVGVDNTVGMTVGVGDTAETTTADTVGLASATPGGEGVDGLVTEVRVEPDAPVVGGVIDTGIDGAVPGTDETGVVVAMALDPDKPVGVNPLVGVSDGELPHATKSTMTSATASCWNLTRDIADPPAVRAQRRAVALRCALIQISSTKTHDIFYLDLSSLHLSTLSLREGIE